MNFVVDGAFHVCTVGMDDFKVSFKMKETKGSCLMLSVSVEGMSCETAIASHQ